MIVEDIASQSSNVFMTLYDWKDTFLGFIFPQVVQKH